MTTQPPDNFRFTRFLSAISISPKQKMINIKTHLYTKMKFKADFETSGLINLIEK
jgi:hypothetical protein